MATDFISREAAIGKITALINKSGKYTAYESGADDACYIVEHEIPTADVRPVVHGRWIPMTYIRELTENGWPNCRWEKAIEPDSVDGLMCSECGEIFDFADARNFCSNCSADMRPERGTKE